MEYKITIRVYSDADKKLLDQVKKDFMDTSLSKAIIRLAKEYYNLKYRDEVLRKAVKMHYEIPSETINKLFG